MEVAGAYVVIVKTDQVLERVAHICAKLDVVPSHGVTPVVYQLVLIFFLEELGSRRSDICKSLDIELWQAAIQRQVPLIHSGNAQLCSQRLIEAGLQLVNVPAEPTKSNVSQPGCGKSVVETSGEAVSPPFVGAGKSIAAEALSSSRAENRGTVQ